MDIIPVNNNEISVVQRPVIENNHSENVKTFKFGSKCRPFAGLCSFVLFTILCITTAIIICVVVQKKTNTICQINFKRTTESAIGYDSRPRHVDMADLNNDTHVDIIVANSGSDCIGIFLGNGLGTFEDQMTYSTKEGSSPFSLAHGYFNDDTLWDIVVANYGINSIGVLLGNGNGTFKSPIMTSLGASRPFALAVGDLNKDNYLDVASANYGTFTITLLFGLNDGSFRIGLTLEMGYDSQPYSLVITDFNKDNNLDIIVVNYGTSNLAILLANYNGSYVRQEYSTGNSSQPSCVIIEDFNNDHILDIATSNSATGNIGIFLGYGNGSVRDMIIFSTGFDSHPEFINTNDFTNDSILDLVIIDRMNSVVLVLKGDGHGNFSIITNHSTGYHSEPTSIASGDVDNDKIPDIIITNNATNDILLLTQYQSYPTIKPMMYSITNYSSINSPLVEVADLNNDNFTDVVLFSNGDSNVQILLNLDNGTFQDERLSLISGPDLVIIDDVNNDKYLDLILLISVNYEIQILLGYGNGTFDNDSSYIIKQESYPESMAVGDLNDDHFLDIFIILSPDGLVHVLYGYENGSFRDTTVYSTAADSEPTFVFVGDFNNDRILDIVTSIFNNGRIDILLGSINESYTLSWRITTDAIFNSLALGDLNNDYYLDIVYASASSSHLGIAFGYGNGRFTNITQYYTTPGYYSRSVVLGHMNNDTFLDIVVANFRDDSISIIFGLGNGSFLPQTRFPTIYNPAPNEIQLGDFNNDKQLDIVATSTYDNNIGIYIMYYEMDFRHETNYFTGSGPHPYSVAIGYFNGDNQPDIVVANSGNDNIQLLLSYDKGMFMNKPTYSTGLGTEPQFVIVGDFNRDNQSDIAVATNRNGAINVFLGNNNGTLNIPSVHPMGSNTFPSSIAVGDFNEDNWTDIVVANYGTNNISVFLGFNYATFTNETIGNPGKSVVPLGITVGDFNNDHRWDIVVANADSKNIDVYLGHGNGSFAAPISIPTGFEPSSAVVGDFNDDKLLDIVVADIFGRSLNTWIGLGNGSFQNQKIESMVSSYSIDLLVVGDINHDDILDVVVTYIGSNLIGVFMGQGNGSFTDDILFFLPYHSSPQWIAVNDFNNDHFLDVIVANPDQNHIDILYGYGNGSFGNVTTLFTGNNSGTFTIATADVNNDSWIDIIAANQQGKNVGIFLGYSNGTFSSQTTYSTGAESSLSQIVLGDLNSDGKLDIAVTDLNNGNNNVAVFYGYGNGDFTGIKSYSTGLNTDPRWLTLSDFDNDSRLDMAIIYFNKNNIGIMLQRQTEPFATSLMYSTGDDSHPKSVGTGDFNHDDHLDIAVANSGTNNILLFLGYGNGTFAAQQTFLTDINSQAVSLAVGQLNNDTHLDIVVANSGTNTISIFHGNGNGNITLFANYSTGISSIPSSVIVKDLNRDTYFDIVVTNIGSNDVIVFFGSNNGSFLESKSYSLGYQARPQAVTIEDMNNDSLYDIIVANSGNDLVEILLQTC